MKRLVHIVALLAAGSVASAQPATGDPPVEDKPPSDAPAGAEQTSDQSAGDEDGAAEDDSVPGETVYIVAKDDNVVPGSAQAIDEAELERFEHDDVHRILAAISGVYIREEEGYGLRPNIGMRGSGSERSAKIALMEDGVLIAPAPYSAPAAYYFPLLTRMTRIEVLKGPAAVQHGPNTVGGALNLISRPIARARATTLDAALGSELYGKLHASHTESFDRFGLLIEGVKLRTDGFKILDGGGDTGFDKNNIIVKLRGNTDVRGYTYNEFGAKLAYSDELSSETYTGLSDDDFARTPNRRYRATMLDELDWQHLQLQLSHKLEVGGDFSLLTQAYRHDFDRSWRKLNGFNNTAGGIADVLANPTAGNNAVLYSVLTGASDSTSDAEALVIGTNERRFVSQGIQSVAKINRQLLSLDHALSAGVRVHYDRALRYHTEELFMMTQGDLMSGGAPPSVTRDSVGTALAVAAFAHNAASYGRLTVSAGGRVETVSIEHTDFSDRVNDSSDRYTVFIPGGGVFYKLLEEVGLLAGVHKGFVPVAPGQEEDVAPEESVNYELGARFGTDHVRGEIVGFFSDYSNLKGTCTFSSGCQDAQVDNEFNGGAVHVIGVEASAQSQLDVGPLKLPLRASYTLNRSRFQTAFTSSNPQWGDVEAGDEIPYLPTHQLSLTVGVVGTPKKHHVWDVALSGRFTSAMRDIAGSGETVAAERTDSATVLDVAVSYSVATWGKAYLTLSNALNQAHIVSRRPFGARPGRPRSVVVGYKNSFF